MCVLLGGSGAACSVGGGGSGRCAECAGRCGAAQRAANAARALQQTGDSLRLAQHHLLNMPPPCSHELFLWRGVPGGDDMQPSVGPVLLRIGSGGLLRA
jgi:hypothetical protein